MRRYKVIEDDCIVAIGKGAGNIEITEEEYSEIMAVIKNRPRAAEGFEYVLTSSLTWELREAAAVERELTDGEVLGIILGGAV